MALIQATTRCVSEQVHVGASRRELSDVIEQGAQNSVSQTTPLVLGEDRHVDDVEVPAPVTEQAAHGRDLASLGP